MTQEPITVDIDRENILSLNFTAAKKHLASFGISLTKITDTGEYRMNKGNREATAYYTDDLRDAIETAYAQYITPKKS